MARGDIVPTITPERRYGPQKSHASTIGRSPTSSTTARLTWRFYTSTIEGDGGGWSGYQAVKHIRYGPDWSKDVITPQTQFFNDVAAGNLANVTWITPLCENSDHPNCGGKVGSAVGLEPRQRGRREPVLEDDRRSSSCGTTGADCTTTSRHPTKTTTASGFRVPLLVISPYAKKDYVSHVQYENGSILRFIEDQYGLGQLAASDRRANDPGKDNRSTSRTPRGAINRCRRCTRRVIFMNRPLDQRPPDDQ